MDDQPNDMKPCPGCGKLLAANLIERILDPNDTQYSCPGPEKA